MRSLVLSLALTLVLAGAALGFTFNTPTLDGTIQPEEWGVESFFDIYYESSCPYGFTLTWDLNFLYVGLDSDVCRRYLGDGSADLSFFVAIDVNQTFGSGAPADGYGNVRFAGCYMPEYIYYYAGNAGWYEWAYWDGAAWQWRGWRSDNTYYAWSGGPSDDELAIVWADLGNPEGIAVTAWLTDEVTFECGAPGVLAAWPMANPVGVCPTFTWAYPYFQPFVPGPMPFPGFAPNSVPADNCGYTATQPTSWGAIKALYK